MIQQSKFTFANFSAHVIDEPQLSWNFFDDCDSSGFTLENGAYCTDSGVELDGEDDYIMLEPFQCEFLVLCLT